MSNELTIEQEAVREEILSALRTDICTVVFTKRDGTERTMRCTLKQSLLPMQEAPKVDEANYNASQPTKAQKKPIRNISVWDLDLGSWRSFNIPNIINWKRES